MKKAEDLPPGHMLARRAAGMSVISDPSESERRLARLEPGARRSETGDLYKIEAYPTAGEDFGQFGFVPQHWLQRNVIGQGPQQPPTEGPSWYAGAEQFWSNLYDRIVAPEGPRMEASVPKRRRKEK